jgi:glutathione synthase/RimK-type ligase-like ATP-grasp enzyme
MCRKIVSDSGLIFGAIDLVQHDGEYYFLEINPNGEWGWLQHPHDVPIANALCDVFVAHDRKKAL